MFFYKLLRVSSFFLFFALFLVMFSSLIAKRQDLFGFLLDYEKARYIHTTIAPIFFIFFVLLHSFAGFALFVKRTFKEDIYLYIFAFLYVLLFVIYLFLYYGLDLILFGKEGSSTL